ncbi:MAG: fructosamine kinase family protein [Chlorobi bacterium]|nr:fructosamine kinase family protein [Chlorobiota bacterium]
MTKISTLGNSLLGALEEKLRKRLGQAFRIQHIIPVYGGDINSSYRIKTNLGDYFVKINDNDIYPHMFEKEARGLQLLRSTGNVHVPETIDKGVIGHTAFLVLEFIEKGEKPAGFWEQFGSEIAGMHRQTQRYYGLDEDNYIGSLLQINKQDSSWVNFFIQNRLRYQLKLATNKGIVSGNILEKFERLFDMLHGLFPIEFPHLIHGDLWSGNFLCSREGHPYIFDPAVYYGNREMDLAMTRLFGGFDQAFYDAYLEAFPLQPDWEERLPVYQLYPLLVHLNLFGISYLEPIMTILNRYVGGKTV